MSGLANNKHLPKPNKLRNFYTPAEVSLHNTADDCWVSFFHKVYDLTLLIQNNYSELCEPIIKSAGTDITHWFDSETKEVSIPTKLLQPKTFVDPKTNLRTFYCP
jgi:cytochrome b involved in lipid metabolism